MKRYFIVMALVPVLLAGCAHVPTNGASTGAAAPDTAVAITVYKSPTCGCCTRYTAHLREAGYDVTVETVRDMQTIKSRYDIPRNMESCHTAVVGDYFVEGHVPIAAVTKLLDEQPTIDGIALPGMPAGSPGMPGVQTAPFQVFALSDGAATPYDWE